MPEVTESDVPDYSSFSSDPQYQIDSEDTPQKIEQKKQLLQDKKKQEDARALRVQLQKKLVKVFNENLDAKASQKSMEDKFQRQEKIIDESFQNQKNYFQAITDKAQSLIKQMEMMGTQTANDNFKKIQEEKSMKLLQLERLSKKNQRQRLVQALQQNDKSLEALTYTQQLKDQINILIKASDLLAEKNIQMASRIDEIQNQMKLDEMNNYFVDECDQLDKCELCSQNPKCGWCRTEDKCYKGDSIGPLDGVCSIWDFDKCPIIKCGGLRTCGQCMLRQDCGWCESSKSCYSGTRDIGKEPCPIGYMHIDKGEKCPMTDLELRLVAQALAQNKLQEMMKQ